MGRPKGSFETRCRSAARQKMWNVIRFHGKRGEAFTAAAVCAATDATLGTFMCYATALVAVGALVRETGRPGPGAAPSVYRLARDLGPKAPVARRQYVVYDPNAGKAMEPQRGGAK